MKRRRIVWDLLLVGGAVVVGIALSVRTWEAYHDQRIKADQKSQEARKAESEREELLKQKAKYESPAGKEQLARDQGYTRPGEKPLTGGN